MGDPVYFERSLMNKNQDPDRDPQGEPVEGGVVESGDSVSNANASGPDLHKVGDAAPVPSSSSAIALPSLDEFDEEDAAATLSVLRTQDQELNALLAAIDDDESSNTDLDDSNLGVLAPEPEPRRTSRASQPVMKSVSPASSSASSMVGGSASLSGVGASRSGSNASLSAARARRGSVSPGSAEAAGRALSSSGQAGRARGSSSPVSAPAPPKAESGVWNDAFLAQGAVQVESVIARWDLYGILGVDEDVERDGLTMAYVERVNDINTAYASSTNSEEVGALERIKAMLVQVYEVLADESKRAHYRAFAREGMVPYRYYKLRMDDEPPLARSAQTPSSSTVRPVRELRRRARTLSGGRRIVLKTGEMEAVSPSRVIKSRQKRSVGQAMGLLMNEGESGAPQDSASQEGGDTEQPLDSFGGAWSSSPSNPEVEVAAQDVTSEYGGASPLSSQGLMSGERPAVTLAAPDLPEAADEDAALLSEGSAPISIDALSLDDAGPSSLDGAVLSDDRLEAPVGEQRLAVSTMSPSLGGTPAKVEANSTEEGARVFSTPSMKAVGAVVFKTAEEMERKVAADQKAQAAERAKLEAEERRTSRSQMKAKKETKKAKAAKKSGLSKKAKRVKAFSGAEYKPEGDPFKGPLVFGVGNAVRGLVQSVLLFAVVFCVSYIMVKFMGMGAGELSLKLEEPMIAARSAVLAVVALLGVVVVRRESLSRFGMLPNWLGVLPAFAGAIIVGMIAGVIARFELSSEDTIEMLMAVVAIRALGEALFFQGFLTRTMLIEFSQPAGAVFVSAILYGIYSLSYAAFMDIDPGAVGYVALIYAFGGGMPFALMYWQTRSIFMAFICQFTVLALTAWSSWNHAVSMGL